MSTIGVECKILYLTKEKVSIWNFISQIEYTATHLFFLTVEVFFSVIVMFFCLFVCLFFVVKYIAAYVSNFSLLKVYIYIYIYIYVFFKYR